MDPSLLPTTSTAGGTALNCHPQLLMFPSSLFSLSLSTKLRSQLMQLCGRMFTLGSLPCAQGLQKSQVLSQANPKPSQNCPISKGNVFIRSQLMSLSFIPSLPTT